jgi:Spy/CpxP family protein refolding chaperone
MKTETTLRSSRIVLPVLLSLVVLLLAGISGQVRAQEPSTQNPAGPAQAQTQTQINQLPDFAPLNLSPDQIQKIRSINAELKDQRQTANQRLRLAQRSLTEAIEAPTPNEALIEQRSREVAEAQASTIRLRSLTEARILQALTPEQRVRLREMRRNQAMRREGNQQRQGNVLRQRQQGLQRNVNAQPGLGPNQPKPMRRQQRP